MEEDTRIQDENEDRLSPDKVSLVLLVYNTILGFYILWHLCATFPLVHMAMRLSPEDLRLPLLSTTVIRLRFWISAVVIVLLVGYPFMVLPTPKRCQKHNQTVGFVLLAGYLILYCGLQEGMLRILIEISRSFT